MWPINTLISFILPHHQFLHLSLCLPFFASSFLVASFFSSLSRALPAIPLLLWLIFLFQSRFLPFRFTLLVSLNSSSFSSVAFSFFVFEKIMGKLARLIDSEEKLARFREAYNIPNSVHLKNSFRRWPILIPKNREVLIPILIVVEGGVWFPLHPCYFVSFIVTIFSPRSEPLTCLR